MSLQVIILAGGSGSRMHSDCPKVLHQLAGKPLIRHVYDTVAQLNAASVFVVHGHKGEAVKTAIQDLPVTFVEQKERLGTGHAVLQASPLLDDNKQTLILYGDIPLISHTTLNHLVSSTGIDQLGLLTAEVDNPQGLGRIIRNEFKQVARIVEDKDASDIERQIHEINTGIYCLPTKKLKEWLPKLSNENAQGEYYLTDIISFATEEHVTINVSPPKQVEEIYGANNRSELAKLESIYQSWQAQALMQRGTTLIDPSRVDIRGQINAGKDCIVDINVIFEGNVTMGNHCHIGPHVILKNVTLGDGVHIQANSILEDCHIENQASIGPFARIRPETVIGKGAKIGNFVEIKKTRVGQGSKINHLSYVGDATIGNNVNIGAGVITCNYDGAFKHQTTIEHGAFIGSNTQLIAPITIGEKATIGAGSTITKDVPAQHLGLSRSKQTNINHWARPTQSTTKLKG